MDANAYFAGRDPALDLVLGPGETRAIETIIETDGTAAASLELNPGNTTDRILTRPLRSRIPQGLLIRPYMTML